MPKQLRKPQRYTVTVSLSTPKTFVAFVVLTGDKKDKAIVYGSLSREILEKYLGYKLSSYKLKGYSEFDLDKYPEFTAVPMKKIWGVNTPNILVGFVGLK